MSPHADGVRGAILAALDNPWVGGGQAKRSAVGPLRVGEEAGDDGLLRRHEAILPHRTAGRKPDNRPLISAEDTAVDKVGGFWLRWHIAAAHHLALTLTLALALHGRGCGEQEQEQE